MFYYFIIVSCFHLSLASWLLFSNKVQSSKFHRSRDKTSSKRHFELRLLRRAGPLELAGSGELTHPDQGAYLSSSKTVLLHTEHEHARQSAFSWNGKHTFSFRKTCCSQQLTRDLGRNAAANDHDADKLKQRMSGLA